MKRKLRGRRAWKCKIWVGAKGVPSWTCLQITSAWTRHIYSAVNGNLRKNGATSSPVQWLHQCKVHMKRKLRGRRAWKCKIWVVANSVPSRTGLETSRSTSIPHSAVNGNLRKFVATSSPVRCLHHCYVHMKRKLRGRRAWKCKIWVGKKDIPSKTGLEITRSSSISHSAVNGNLRKFAVTSTLEQCLHHCKVH